MGNYIPDKLKMESLERFEHQKLDSEASSSDIAGTADERAGKLMLRNIRAFIRGVSSSQGTKPKEIQSMIDIVASVIMSEDMVSVGLGSAIMRVSGMSRVQQARGLKLQKENQRTVQEGGLELKTGIKRQAHSIGPRSKLDLDWVYDWFHEDCDIIEIDKSRKHSYKNKKITCAGKTRRIVCQRRVVNGLKKDAVDCLMASAEYKNHTKRLGRDINRKTLEQCICRCMKEAKPVECACSMCVEFRYALSAWDSQRKIWHEGGCSCRGCMGPRHEGYMTASKSTSAFKKIVCCAKQPYPHLTLPHIPLEVPHFIPLKCCTKSARVPGHVRPCRDCGWEEKMYNHHNCVERSEDVAKWKIWVMSDIDGNSQRPVLQEHTGTRRELLNTIMRG